MMQASKAKFRLHVASARPYMVPQRHGKPTSFSSLDDDIEDEAWDTDVRDEPSIDDQAPDGLDMDKSLLVKPVGTMNASFVLAGSHLTVDTTTHLCYSTADDVSNTCMFALLAKTGYHQPRIQPAELAIIDRFLGRISRGTIVGLSRRPT